MNITIMMWTDRQMDRYITKIHRQIDRQKDTHVDKQTDSQVERHIFLQTDRQTFRQMIDRCETDRQTNYI